MTLRELLGGGPQSVWQQGAYPRATGKATQLVRDTTVYPCAAPGQARRACLPERRRQPLPSCSMWLAASHAEGPHGQKKRREHVLAARAHTAAALL